MVSVLDLSPLAAPSLKNYLRIKYNFYNRTKVKGYHSGVQHVFSEATGRHIFPKTYFCTNLIPIKTAIVYNTLVYRIQHNRRSNTIELFDFSVTTIDHDEL